VGSEGVVRLSVINRSSAVYGIEHVPLAFQVASRVSDSGQASRLRSRCQVREGTEERKGEYRWLRDALQIREVDDHVVNQMKKQHCTVQVTYATETGGNAGGR
jgi:hypothetical protein